MHIIFNDVAFVLNIFYITRLITFICTLLQDVSIIRRHFSNRIMNKRKHLQIV